MTIFSVENFLKKNIFDQTIICLRYFLNIKHTEILKKNIYIYSLFKRNVFILKKNIIFVCRRYCQSLGFKVSTSKPTASSDYPLKCIGIIKWTLIKNDKTIFF